MSRRTVGTLVGAVFFFLSLGLGAHPFIAGFSYDPAAVWIAALGAFVLSLVLSRVIGGKPPAPASGPPWIAPGPVTLAGKTWKHAALWLVASLLAAGFFAAIAHKLLTVGIGVSLYPWALLVVVGFSAAMYFFVKEWAEYLRFGSASLHLARYPLSPGERLEGKLQFRKTVALDALRVELACIKVVHRTEDNWEETDIWTQGVAAPVVASPEGSFARISLAIPDGLPVTTDPMWRGHGSSRLIRYGVEYYRWELRLKADVEGIDLGRAYRLKVQEAGPGGPRAA